MSEENKPKRENLVIDWFVEQMKKKLELKRQNGGLEDSHNHYLVRRLIEDTGELIQYVMMNEFGDPVIEKAADVANFCLMIADNAYVKKVPITTKK